MRRIAKSLAMSLVLALGLVLAACESTSAVITSSQQSGTITVNASSEIKVVPDKADFNVEVQAEGKTAKEAQDAAKKPVNAVIKALKAAGIKDKSIQTVYTSVSPVYDWTSSDSGALTITGYESFTRLRVSGVDVDAVSSLMDTCLAAGATGVDGPTYSTESYEEAYEKALADAISASRDKASAMAKAAGVSLGKVVSITEGYENTSYRYDAKAINEEAADADSEMEIASGEVTIEAQVTVTYSIG